MNGLGLEKLESFVGSLSEWKLWIVQSDYLLFSILSYNLFILYVQVL